MKVQLHLIPGMVNIGLIDMRNNRQSSLEFLFGKYRADQYKELSSLEFLFLYFVNPVAITTWYGKYEADKHED